MGAGKAAGCTTIFVLTGHGAEELAKIQASKLNEADIVVENILQAAQKIIALE